MSVQPTPITVTSMLSVIIPRDLIIVPVLLDTLEMEVVALVRTWPFSLLVCGWCVCLVRFRIWKPIVANKVVFLSNRCYFRCQSYTPVKIFVKYIFFSRWELSFIDVDECMINTHNCDIKAVCNNTEGSHNCTCKPGYSGDGISSCTGNNVFLFFVVYIYDWGVSYDKFCNRHTMQSFIGRKNEFAQIYSLQIYPKFVKTEE